jgi:tetratricopeptide (TPR) repeat protein
VTHVSARTVVSPALAAQLEAQGHEMVQTGQYAQAIAVLRRALAATGASLSGCVQPTGETCLTYAYALYDLGRALRLNGSAAQAVGVLEHRLQIENQRPVVVEELASARRQLG